MDTRNTRYRERDKDMDTFNLEVQRETKTLDTLNTRYRERGTQYARS